MVFVLVLTGCTTQPAPPPPRPTTSTPTEPDCPGSGVTLRVGVSEAAMGLRVLGVTMTNCGTRAHTVTGYPAVRVLDADRRELDVQVGEGSSDIAVVPAFDAPPAPVTLEPGETATSGVMWRNTVTDSTVDATLGTFLMISPAPGEPWQEVAADAPVNLDLGNTGKLGVRPWTSP
jgi:hypothetical protein